MPNSWLMLPHNKLLRMPLLPLLLRLLSQSSRLPKPLPPLLLRRQLPLLKQRVSLRWKR